MTPGRVRTSTLRSPCAPCGTPDSPARRYVGRIPRLRAQSVRVRPGQQVPASSLAFELGREPLVVDPLVGRVLVDSTRPSSVSASTRCRLTGRESARRQRFVGRLRVVAETCLLLTAGKLPFPALRRCLARRGRAGAFTVTISTRHATPVCQSDSPDDRRPPGFRRRRRVGR